MICVRRRPLERCRRSPGDRGSVTAEFAVAMPAVLLVLALSLSATQVAATQLRLQDAAADAARALARGETVGVASSGVSAQVAGATLSRSASGDLVCATVSARPTGLAATFGLTVSASSCAVGGGR